MRRWLRASGYDLQREFRGAFAVKLYLLETVFKPLRDEEREAKDPWREATRQARRTWDLVLKA